MAGLQILLQKHMIMEHKLSYIRSIDGPGHDNVELAPAGVFQHGIEARPAVSALGVGDAGVAINLDHFPAAALSNLAKLADLVRICNAARFTCFVIELIRSDRLLDRYGASWRINTRPLGSCDRRQAARIAAATGIANIDKRAMSVPASSRWVAKPCRSVCVETPRSQQTLTQHLVQVPVQPLVAVEKPQHVAAAAKRHGL
jgi:hypothetical protein